MTSGGQGAAAAGGGAAGAPGGSRPAAPRLVGAFLAGYPLVFAARSLRALFLTLLLAGTASGMAMAYVAVWASETLGAGPGAVATLFVVSGATGAVANPLIGLLSDRFGWRRRLIVLQLVVVSLAYLGYTRADSYAAALGLAALSSFGIMGLALALVNDLVQALPEAERRNAARILAAERTAWSIGIIVGPAVAAGIVAASGETRPVFVAAALTQLLAAGVAWASRPAPGAPVGGAAARRRAAASPPARPLPRAALLGLVAGLVLVTLPAQTRTTFLPLFVTRVLGEPAGTVGPLFTLNAVVAVLTMPHVGAAADRHGAQRLLYLGALVGVVYCLLQSLAGSYVQTLAIQTLIGFGIGLWSAAALIYVQGLLPGRAGAAGGLYVAVQQVTPVLAGLLLGPVAEGSGIPAAFRVAAGLGVLALVLLAGAHRALAGPGGAGAQRWRAAER